VSWPECRCGFCRLHALEYAVRRMFRAEAGRSQAKGFFWPVEREKGGIAWGWLWNHAYEEYRAQVEQLLGERKGKA
jgi:hypothetical protein